MTNKKLKRIPLLTIAIPTYNRAEILNNSLSMLLPQIIKNSNEIELLISDNASDDNTQMVVNKYQKKYRDINIITNIQPKNTGYFGNFKKCRELSNGKYFWLLSDNEHLLSNALNFIISELKKNDRIGVLFFRNEKECVPYVQNVKNTDDFFANDPKSYFITLISAVIMRNIKNIDEEILKKYKNNAFLGFLFLGASLIKYNSIKIIEGKFFYSYYAVVSFNVFWVWTKDINECLDFFSLKMLISDKTRGIFTNSYLMNVCYYHILEYLCKGKIYNIKFARSDEILKQFDYYYLNNSFYLKRMRPLFFMSKYSLNIKYYALKLINKFNRWIVTPVINFFYDTKINNNDPNWVVVPKVCKLL